MGRASRHPVGDVMEPGQQGAPRFVPLSQFFSGDSSGPSVSGRVWPKSNTAAAKKRVQSIVRAKTEQTTATNIATVAVPIGIMLRPVVPWLGKQKRKKKS